MTAPFFARAITEDYRGRIALVSSFGAESAVLLHLVASVDPTIPVLFIDTEKLFGETLRYRDRLVQRLGLTDLRVIKPDPIKINAADPDGALWRRNPDLCCRLRKVEPLARALKDFDAWINGRKRYQSNERNAIPPVETVDGKIKINPLFDWTKQDIETYFETYDLERHPLVADGYRSIGCMPCTDRVRDGEDDRAGRWRSAEKTECGIHLSGMMGDGI